MGLNNRGVFFIWFIEKDLWFLSKNGKNELRPVLLFVLVVWRIMVSFLSCCKSSLNSLSKFRLFECFRNVLSNFINDWWSQLLLCSNFEILCVNVVYFFFLVNVIIEIFFSRWIAVFVRTLLKCYQILNFIFSNLLLNLQFSIWIFEQCLHNPCILFKFDCWVKVSIDLFFWSQNRNHKLRLSMIIMTFILSWSLNSIQRL